MKVLCVWEMGAGLGHLSRLKPFVVSAVDAGFQVSLAVKELDGVHSVFPEYSLNLFQAPYDNTPAVNKEPISLLEALLARYREPRRLASYLVAWRSIFRSVSPDLVIYDSSPTALLAGLDGEWAKWTTGSPFFMPRTDLPYVGPFPNISSFEEHGARLERSQHQLLSLVNASLSEAKMDSISNVGEIFNRVNRELLTTVPELDYFGPRSVGEYIGMPASPEANRSLPPWPEKRKLKIFVYLRDFKGREKFIASLGEKGLYSIVYSPGMGRRQSESFAGHVYLDGPALMSEVCQQADLVVHMGGSQTVARCLAAGVPQMLLVSSMEQTFTAKSALNFGSMVICKALASDYSRAIDKAVEIAERGRFDPPLIQPELLDGSVMNRRIPRLFDELSAP